MINRTILKSIIEKYKQSFDARWNDEKYKWEAVLCFQQNWDIQAPNFAEMFERATDKAGNLLTSLNYFPRGMIMEMAKADQNSVRDMFLVLYDESRPSADRMKYFLDATKAIKAKYDPGTWKNTFQNTNSISTYLWLKYPDKYYIYKYSEYLETAKMLESTFAPRRTGKPEEMCGGFKMYDEICEAIQDDAELRDMLNRKLTDECYPDTSLHTLAIDIGYYITRFYNAEKITTTEEWFPKDYDPEITVDKWVELLNDNGVFNAKSLMVMRRMQDIGGQATCAELADKYGETPNFYIMTSVNLAQRINIKTGCPLIAREDTGKPRWWAILYTGKEQAAAKTGTYIWRLRHELAEALTRIDMSAVPLYGAYEGPAIWKISHGTEATGVPDAKKQIFEERQVITVDNATRAKGISKIAQGENFAEAIKKGDFFYLCYGSSVRLLGQINTDEVVQNPQMDEGWLEWGYRIIALSQDTLPYTGVQKWWSPNDNSTCIKVEDNEKALFESVILKPYFNMTLNDLKVEAASTADIIRKKDIPAVSVPENEPYTKNNFLEDVYMDSAQYDTLASLLRYKKNLILQGVPGVGKTYAAKKLAYAMMGEKDDSRIECVQFHQSYSYEDFVMGYKPYEDGFRLTHGVFYEFCHKAISDQEREYFFIIDEINRGNLSKIFGELLMLIEKDHRNEVLKLAGNGSTFSVPENLYIIGTMNTADRSLAIIDYALRRRFSFYNMEPGFDTQGFKQYQAGLNNEAFDELIARIEQLNREIAVDSSLGRGFMIGHSYFCNAKTCTDEWFKNVVYFEILPMLREYWFDDAQKLQHWEAVLSGVLNDD